MNRSLFIVPIIACTAALMIWSCIIVTDNDSDSGYSSHTQSICIDFRSESGELSLPADGESCLKIEGFVTDCETGAPVEIYQLSFSHSSGSIRDVQTFPGGRFEFTYCAGCIPGGVIITFTINNVPKTLSFDLYGDYPYIMIETNSSNICAAGGLNPVIINVFSSCVGADYMVKIWGESGCFSGGTRELSLVVNDAGNSSFIWFPPVWGTSSIDDGDDFSAPRSVVLTAEFFNSQGETGFEGSTVLYLYPLHGRLYLNGGQEFHAGPIIAVPGETIVLSTSVFCQDAYERTPVGGVPVSWWLETMGAQADLDVGISVTDDSGNAYATMAIGAESGSLRIHSLIELPGICEHDSQRGDGWIWSDSAEIIVVP